MSSLAKRAARQVVLPAAGSGANWPRPRLAAVWLLAPVATAALAGGLTPLESIDLWWSLLLGASPSGPDPVVFTPLAGSTVNVQWLAQRALADLVALGGTGLLQTVRALVLALTVLLLHLSARTQGADARQAGLATWLALPLLLAGAAVRPQLAVLPLFALILLVGGSLARRRWAAPSVVAVAALWANLHGSFVLAPLVLTLLALGDPTQRVPRLRLAALALVATLLNPWYVDIWPAILEVTRANGGGGSGGLALEWRPLALGSTTGLFFLLLGGAALLGAARWPSRERAGWLALLVALGLLAIGGGRHSVWFALAAVPLTARVAPRGKDSPGPTRLTFGLLGLSGVMLAIGLVYPLIKADRQLATDTPLEVAARLRDVETQRIFAFSDWGGYLAWALRPNTRVYIDNRFEQHPAAIWSTYRSISLAEPGWEAALDQAGVDALALQPRNQAPLVAAADLSSGWQRLASDDRGVVFVRRRAADS